MNTHILIWKFWDWMKIIAITNEWFLYNIKEYWVQIKMSFPLKVSQLLASLNQKWAIFKTVKYSRVHSNNILLLLKFNPLSLKSKKWFAAALWSKHREAIKGFEYLSCKLSGQISTIKAWNSSYKYRLMRGSQKTHCPGSDKLANSLWQCLSELTQSWASPSLFQA